MAYSTVRTALSAGAIASVIGLIAFILNWQLWDWWNGPLPGYGFWLWAGNLSLVYVWHPLFTEEIDLLPTLFLLLLGQFVIVTLIVAVVMQLLKLNKATKSP